MAPLQVDILLQARWNPDICFSDRVRCPAGVQAVMDFADMGVLEVRKASRKSQAEPVTFVWIELTDKGNAWVDSILATPCPVERTTTHWVDPRTDEKVGSRISKIQDGRSFSRTSEAAEVATEKSDLRKSVTVTLTGPAGAGKSTIAHEIGAALRDRGLNVSMVDEGLSRRLEACLVEHFEPVDRSTILDARPVSIQVIKS